ncbi:hypothetical protein, partial [Actinoplanes sp. NPDC005259]|uniref:hypothetical protein n=1 Tax=Actinoplanes sp. NPDC005259 TaxID=3154674 RepID=UPI0033BA1E87
MKAGRDQCTILIRGSVHAYFHKSYSSVRREGHHNRNTVDHPHTIHGGGANVSTIAGAALRSSSVTWKH